jgi:electron transfer flavoprotein alpha subunit
MAEILVLDDHLDGAVKKVTTELLTKARELGEPSAVFVGSGVETAKERLAEYGAQKIYVADAGDLGDYVVAPKVAVLAKLVAEKSPAAVLIASGPEGKEIAARLAVRTDSGVVTDAVDLKEGLSSAAPRSCSPRWPKAPRSSPCDPTPRPRPPRPRSRPRSR